MFLCAFHAAGRFQVTLNLSLGYKLAILKDLFLKECCRDVFAEYSCNAKFCVATAIKLGKICTERINDQVNGFKIVSLANAVHV